MGFKHNMSRPPGKPQSTQARQEISAKISHLVGRLGSGVWVWVCSVFTCSL